MYIMKTNIVDLRNKLSEMLDFVQQGNELEIQKRNVIIAKLVPIPKAKVNKTKLDIGKGYSYNIFSSFLSCCSLCN